MSSLMFSHFLLILGSLGINSWKYSSSPLRCEFGEALIFVFFEKGVCESSLLVPPRLLKLSPTLGEKSRDDDDNKSWLGVDSHSSLDWAKLLMFIQWCLSIGKFDYIRPSSSLHGWFACYRWILNLNRIWWWECITSLSTIPSPSKFHTHSLLIEPLCSLVC